MKSSKKRKERHVSDLKRRFVVERDRFMQNNELAKVTQFEDMMKFNRRYVNGITGKTDRGIPSWVFSHIHEMNKLIKSSNDEYYEFNTNYVITGEILTPAEERERERRLKAEHDLLIMQGRYEEATKNKAQGNS